MLDRFLGDPAALNAVAQAISLLSDALERGRKLLVCGNGGSLCDAMHFAAELTAKYRKWRPALAALPLGDPVHITAMSNDSSFEDIFARMVEALGNCGDVLIALSTSGESTNVLRAAEAARKRGLIILALTGRGGGPLANVADIEIRAPNSAHADRAQEIHIKVLHVLAAGIEENLGLTEAKPPPA